MFFYFKRAGTAVGVRPLVPNRARCEERICDNDELWADWCFANDLANLEDIATVLEVEVDDLIVAVDFVVANSDSSEVVDLKGESFSIRDVYLSTFDFYFDVLHLCICLTDVCSGRFEVGSNSDFGLAGHEGQSCSEGK